jgi:hypothetical protein
MNAHQTGEINMKTDKLCVSTAKKIERELRRWKDGQISDICLGKYLGAIRRGAHGHGLTDDGFHQACEMVMPPWEMTGRQA